VRRKKNYSGIRSGKLELLVYSRPGGGGVGSIWWASCTCGTMVEVVAKQVSSGRVRTCGNCNKGLGIQAGNIHAGSLIPKGHKMHFTHIIRQIVAAGALPRVTPDMYMKLKGNTCVGCGTNETHVELGQQPGRQEEVGSTLLIPICTQCSSWRDGRNVLDWLGYCVRVAAAVRSKLGQ
jgi:hypothetical protein